MRTIIKILTRKISQLLKSIIMKFQIAICFLIIMGFLSSAMSQNVGINTATPDASAILDVQSTNKGMLVPRMSTVQRTAIASHAAGLMVYDTDTHSFWFYKAVTGWVNTLNAITGWCTSGNASTGSEFLGTITNQPLVFKTNNILSGKIEITGQNTFLGHKSGLANTGINNTAFGYESLLSNTTGVENTALGKGALRLMTTGGSNVAIGYHAAFNSTIAQNNIAIGFSALLYN